ncbi:hypothetical protein [Mesobacillus subterraneus]|uniref:Uncharacterized protein n=1 Tax=Mesobacillus subterraneus TaxID=285983 RepID=A0A427TVB5_9BACI|nr:hypothetical protein [Mesobacillus subterraneus]RSD28413.1 hypothetical protein EJA10_04830 [Mesobacillus subterraneus]
MWGLIFLLAGLFVALGSTYMILTKKAINPKGLIMPGALLTVIFLGLAYGFLGVYWDDYAKDALTYVRQGAEEKIIVLKEYEVDQDFGRFSGPTEYIYITSQGEAFTTQTIFEVDLILGAEYKVHYLSKTNYLVGIERIN